MEDNAMEVEGSSSRSGGAEQPAELADAMCAGPVIGSPHLIRILFALLSGHGLIPFSLGDKHLVGLCCFGRGFRSVDGQRVNGNRFVLSGWSVDRVDAGRRPFVPESVV